MQAPQGGGPSVPQGGGLPPQGGGLPPQGGGPQGGGLPQGGAGQLPIPSNERRGFLGSILPTGVVMRPNMASNPLLDSRIFAGLERQVSVYGNTTLTRDI
jgi:hypothetical protein